MLLIDSDEMNRINWQKWWVKCGFLCEISPDFKSALLKIDSYSYDNILLFLHQQVQEGLQMIKTIRKEDTDAGLFIVYDTSDFHQKIAFLEEGADDCLSSEIDPNEFWARIKVINRRRFQLPGNVIHFGRIFLFPQERQVLIEEVPLPLTKKEFDILFYLIRNKNRVLTKEKIAEHLWGDHMEESVNFEFIYAHLKNLRKKLAAFDCADYIKTIYGVGYKCQL
jgi:DNA-binding response OmpR family regulator